MLLFIDLPPSWQGFSSTFYYREVVLIPLAIGVLWFLWMRLVGIAFREEASGEGGPRTLSLEEAYFDAVLNEELAGDDDDNDGTKEGRSAEEDEGQEDDDKKSK